MSDSNKDIEHEDAEYGDYPWCECPVTYDIEELDSGVCSCCGKSIND